MEVRGLYREMLTMAWTCEASLPNDPAEIKRAVRCTEEEWKRCWPVVRRYWQTRSDGRLINATQVEIYASALRYHERASTAAQTRWARQAKATLGGGNKHDNKHAPTHRRKHRRKQ